MTDNKGNRMKVITRWGQRKASGSQMKLRKPFKGKPQFTVDGLYITLFTHELTSDELGRKGYTPIVRNFTPSGISILDEYVQALHAGQTGTGDFCNRHNARLTDLDGLIFLLLGMSNADFRNRWIVRCADELLRYTDMEIPEVARRSGAGTRGNLYLIYERDLNCSPTQRRAELRQPGDLGRFKIVE